MVAITPPLYSIAVILSFVASQFTTVVLFGQSGGLYDHYFNTFLNPHRPALVVFCKRC